jgi:hypothetical protein
VCVDNLSSYLEECPTHVMSLIMDAWYGLYNHNEYRASPSPPTSSPEEHTGTDDSDWSVGESDLDESDTYEDLTDDESPGLCA